MLEVYVVNYYEFETHIVKSKHQLHSQAKDYELKVNIFLVNATRKPEHTQSNVNAHVVRTKVRC